MAIVKVKYYLRDRYVGETKFDTETGDLRDMMKNQAPVADWDTCSMDDIVVTKPKPRKKKPKPLEIAMENHDLQEE